MAGVNNGQFLKSFKMASKNENASETWEKPRKHSLQMT